MAEALEKVQNKALTMFISIAASRKMRLILGNLSFRTILESNKCIKELKAFEINLKNINNHPIIFYDHNLTTLT